MQKKHNNLFLSTFREKQNTQDFLELSLPDEVKESLDIKNIEDFPYWLLVGIIVVVLVVGVTMYYRNRYRF